MIDFKMNPQVALDAPRFCINSGTEGEVICLQKISILYSTRFLDGIVYFEDGISEETIQELKRRGHHIHAVPLSNYERSMFGNGYHPIIFSLFV